MQCEDMLLIRRMHAFISEASLTRPALKSSLIARSCLSLEAIPAMRSSSVSLMTSSTSLGLKGKPSDLRIIPPSLLGDEASPTLSPETKGIDLGISMESFFSSHESSPTFRRKFPSLENLRVKRGDAAKLFALYLSTAAKSTDAEEKDQILRESADLFVLNIIANINDIKISTMINGFREALLDAVLNSDISAKVWQNALSRLAERLDKSADADIERGPQMSYEKYIKSLESFDDVNKSPNIEIGFSLSASQTIRLGTRTRTIMAQVIPDAEVLLWVKEALRKQQARETHSEVSVGVLRSIQKLSGGFSSPRADAIERIQQIFAALQSDIERSEEQFKKLISDIELHFSEESVAAHLPTSKGGNVPLYSINSGAREKPTKTRQEFLIKLKKIADETITKSQAQQNEVQPNTPLPASSQQ
ncbi:hypothetical protein O181_037013 [Austropuccinia psidii MF-1]|uniref:Uncharacterized protein n=1 Tax=Austropuccinia psidii MF-1 TaxID=1389203 RepID=A0A9Q3D8J2_9BASI|nr:hypothetical protein [Austropuccinia psidii MF-1]